MRGINPEFINELKAKNNIVEVVSSYFSLTKKGNNYWACCPFHHEKTPSFAVDGVDQFYHCFGCGVSGDVVRFVKEYESVDFIDAVRILADRAGMTVPENGIDAEELAKRKKKKDTHLKIMLASARFYRANLYGNNADAHVSYLAGRNIQPSIIKKFGLGASTDYNSLPEFLLDSGFSREDIVACGVCANDEDRPGRIYDSLGGRLIIPIINSLDEVIAFGGRILQKSDRAKYKNTKETDLFVKNKTLYNINLLKKLKKKQTISSVIMVEGYMDTISLYQAGFTNVVASMGTSLTAGQARLVKRYADNVLLSYDGDFAGQKANDRGSDIFREAQLNVKVVPLPDGLDPDDIVSKQGAEAYQKCLDAAMPLVDYKLYALEKKYDLNDREGKRTYTARALKVIAAEPESTVREELLRDVSRKTGSSVAALSADMKKSGGTDQPLEEIEPAPQREQPAWTKGIPNGVLDASRFLLAAKLFHMDYAKDYRLDGDLFFSEVQTAIADYIAECEESGEKIVPSYLFEIIDEDDSELGEILGLYCEDKLLGADASRYFRDCVTAFEKYALDKRMTDLSESIRLSEDGEEKRFLLGKLTELTQRKTKGKR